MTGAVHAVLFPILVEATNTELHCIFSGLHGSVHERGLRSVNYMMGVLCLTTAHLLLLEPRTNEAILCFYLGCRSQFKIEYLLCNHADYLVVGIYRTHLFLTLYLILFFTMIGLIVSCVQTAMTRHDINRESQYYTPLTVCEQRNAAFIWAQHRFLVLYRKISTINVIQHPVVYVPKIVYACGK